MPKTRRPQDPRQHAKVELSFAEQPCAAAFVNAIKNGGEFVDGEWRHRLTDNQIAAFGTRGDGKTIGALTGMVEHAKEHHAMGYPLPTHWMGVTDTFTSHKMKTVRSMEHRLWGGGWQFSDGDHIASFYFQGAKLVHVDLFGIEDQGAINRVRAETVGVWFEEPAPASVMVESSGIDESAWITALTSQRIPSHFHPAVVTTNYPDEDHWTWRRWVANPMPGTRYFRVPPGERASPEQRAEWIRIMADRPDLLRRLLLGEPGVVMLGDQVAQGFSLDLHVAKERLLPWPGQPIYFGFDFGHTPCCVMAQEQRGMIRFLAGLYLIGAGMTQLMDELVLPWLSRYAPWVRRNPQEMALIGFDPSQGTMEDPKGSEADIENSALQAIASVLDGWFEPGPIAWDIRKELIVAPLRPERNPAYFQLNPEYCRELASAMAGRAYYPKSHNGQLSSDKQKKHNHPWEDLIDAAIYCLSRISSVSMADTTGSSQRTICNILEGM